MNPHTQTMTYNRLELLKLMYLSREGDRREGVLHRQSKGWFQVAGMGHETLAVFSFLMEDGDYLFPYYRDRAMVLAKGVSNAELASAYFAKLGSSSGGRQMPGHYSDRQRNHLERPYTRLEPMRFPVAAWLGPCNSMSTPT